TNTCVRVVDRLVVQSTGPVGEVPSEMPRGFTQLVAVISFKAGYAKGRSMVGVTAEKPSGQSERLLSVPVLFEGEERGAVIHVDLRMPVDQEGLYWLAVDLDRELVTKMPLRVLYQPMPQPPPHQFS
ncbi:MAG: hypothetical protein JOZ39_10545, partial [Chloroflexi bacterium]|nr:hypothetical protein [Chloroflexota bacterium]